VRIGIKRDVSVQSQAPANAPAQGTGRELFELQRCEAKLSNCDGRRGAKAGLVG